MKYMFARLLSDCQIIQMQTTWESLPWELLGAILSYADPDKIIVKFVCRQWRQLWSYGPGSTNDKIVIEYFDNSPIEVKTKLTVYYLLANNYSLAVIDWARQNGCQWGMVNCIPAVSFNRLDVLKYAHEHGLDWDVREPQDAVVNGNLEILKYLHENGCPWNSFVVSLSLRFDHLDCLKYALENSCKVNMRILSRPSWTNRSIQCWQYFQENVLMDESN